MANESNPRWCIQHSASVKCACVQANLFNTETIALNDNLTAYVASAMELAALVRAAQLCFNWASTDLKSCNITSTMLFTGQMWIDVLLLKDSYSIGLLDNAAAQFTVSRIYYSSILSKQIQLVIDSYSALSPI